ncbi:MAG: hypothetical protein MMC33_007762 [Icmadophila ericetorum]|nr:hypothetical protein [Icmadophila ericetorum]
MQIIRLGLHALEFFWTLLIMSLDGNIIHDAFAGNPSIINYIMFVAVLSMLSLIYLILVDFKDGFAVHPRLPFGLEVLNAVLFVIGGIALAAYLGVHSCGNLVYVKHNLITDGSYDMTKRCHEAQAICAFLWFGFATWAVSAASSLMGDGASVSRGGIRRGGPSMSQV